MFVFIQPMQNLIYKTGLFFFVFYIFIYIYISQRHSRYYAFSFSKHFYIYYDMIELLKLVKQRFNFLSCNLLLLLAVGKFKLFICCLIHDLLTIYIYFLRQLPCLFGSCAVNTVNPQVKMQQKEYRKLSVKKICLYGLWGESGNGYIFY